MTKQSVVSAADTASATKAAVAAAALGAVVFHSACIRQRLRRRDIVFAVTRRHAMHCRNLSAKLNIIECLFILAHIGLRRPPTMAAFDVRITGYIYIYTVKRICCVCRSGPIIACSNRAWRSGAFCLVLLDCVEELVGWLGVLVGGGGRSE